MGRQRKIENTGVLLVDGKGGKGAVHYLFSLTNVTHVFFPNLRGEKSGNGQF